MGFVGAGAAIAAAAEGFVHWWMAIICTLTAMWVTAVSLGSTFGLTTVTRIGALLDRASAAVGRWSIAKKVGAAALTFVLVLLLVNWLSPHRGVRRE